MEENYSITSMSKGTMLTLIILLSSFAPISTDMYLPALPQMIVYFGTNETIITMTMYAFLLSLALSVLFLGPLSDKYGRRKILISTLALYTVMSIACGLTDNVWIMILFRILQAIGGGGALAISVALIKDCFTGNSMKTALSAVAILGVLGPVLSPIIGTVLIESINWQATFWLPAMISLICIVLGSRIPGELPHVRYEGTVIGAVKCVGTLLKNRDFTVFAVMISVFTAGLLAYVAVSAYIYQEHFGMNTWEYSALLACTMILGMGINTALQRMTDRIGNVRIIPVFLAVGIISAILIFIIGPMHWALMVIAMAPTIALGMSGRTYGFGILMSQQKDGSGSVSSILNFMTFAFGVVGMVIGSLPWESFITGLGVVVVICCAVYLSMYAIIRIKGSSLKGLYVQD